MPGSDAPPVEPNSADEVDRHVAHVICKVSKVLRDHIFCICDLVNAAKAITDRSSLLTRKACALTDILSELPPLQPATPRILMVMRRRCRAYSAEIPAIQELATGLSAQLTSSSLPMDLREELQRGAWTSAYRDLWEGFQRNLARSDSAKAGGITTCTGILRNMESISGLLANALQLVERHARLQASRRNIRPNVRRRRHGRISESHQHQHYNV